MNLRETAEFYVYKKQLLRSCIKFKKIEKLVTLYKTNSNVVMGFQKL